MPAGSIPRHVSVRDVGALGSIAAANRDRPRARVHGALVVLEGHVCDDKLRANAGQVDRVEAAVAVMIASKALA